VKEDEEEEEGMEMDSFPDYLDLQGSVDEDYENVVHMNLYRRGALS
jgi:hypothetical protein